ncbi:sensor domain-containing diguanylate cyclase [Oceanispirochaeta sp. M1]|uniref:sensor domain-containing diguanylate cyclase n=2 Tax=unclassified Oceanispirochaeta TaxID=2635722 RepID=UPI000E08D3F9|nr:diguanylate cyclase [Oceanispirochaeta sp. M1]RDG32086.1 GGDEF domain-containing protein [Oceanispirochaeta sp. M1]
MFKKKETRMVFNTLLLSLILLSFGFLTINIFHFYFQKQTFKKGILDSTLPMTVSIVTATLEEKNYQYSLISDLLVKEIVDELNWGESVNDPALILSRLMDWSESLNTKNIGLVDLKSQSYFDSFGRVLSLDYTSDRDQWVLEMLEYPVDYRFTLYYPVEEEYEGLYSFFGDRKIRNHEGEIVGLIGLGLSYESIYSRVKDFNEKIKISFLDGDGTIRLPEERRGEDIWSLYELDKQDLSMTFEENSFLHWYKADDQSFLVSVSYLPEIKNHLLIELDISEYYGEFRRKFIFTILSGAIFSLFLIIIYLIYIYRSHKTLHWKACHDSLTGCFNRTFLDHYLSKERKFFKNQYDPLVLVHFDIDLFKDVNDRLGHLKGDEVLIEVALIARSGLRSGDCLVRLGGDEFILILSMGMDRGEEISERLKNTIFEQTGVSISMGITEIKRDDTFEDAMKRADAALYISKERGRNRITRSNE